MSAGHSRLDAGMLLSIEGTEAVLGALEAVGGEVRFVGGCVRNAILGLPLADIDLATDLAPQATIAALQASGLQAIPTGLPHGTVTAVAAGRAFEITTLRRDVETDGRHAVVAFTTDWAADAARRDFTLNALYCDRQGRVHDHVGGLRDLHDRRVRFVGDPAQRIEEDVLRVLRFFRFSAWYGRQPYDAEGLAACKAAAGRLKLLSAERVRKELLTLLEAADPVPALRLMIEGRILVHWLAEACEAETLARLLPIEAALATASAVRRLAALLPADCDAGLIAQRLRLSRAEADRLASILGGGGLPEIASDAAAWRRAVHAMGRGAVADRLLLQAARQALPIEPGSAWRAAWDLVGSWQPPRLPVRGADALAAGLTAGTAVGELLRAVEAWWVAGDFAADRAACLDRLRVEAKARGLVC